MYGRASPMTESAVVTTTATSATSPASAGGDRMQPLGEGRVGKAARRRSRASRKTPTTVLNTDTTNFRAMVQQFTGGPLIRPFQAAFPLVADGGGGPATLNFGLAGATTQFHQQPAVFSLGVHHHQQQQQYQRYSQFQQHHERSVFVPGGTSRSGTASAVDDYFPRFDSSDPERDSTDAGDGLLLERISSSHLLPTPAPSTGSSTTDRFLF